MSCDVCVKVADPGHTDLDDLKKNYEKYMERVKATSAKDAKQNKPGSDYYKSHGKAKDKVVETIKTLGTYHCPKIAPGTPKCPELVRFQEGKDKYGFAP